MPPTETAQAGYWKGDRLELGLRYTYRPDFVPTLMDYLGARPGTHILEVGCGTGFLTRLIARTLNNVNIIGIDTDDEMLTLAEQLVARDGLSGRIVLGHGDVARLPFPDNSFDLVTSQRLL